MAAPSSPGAAMSDRFSITSEPSDEYPTVTPGVKLQIESARFYLSADEADALGQLLQAHANISTARAERYRRSRS